MTPAALTRKMARRKRQLFIAIGPVLADRQASRPSKASWLHSTGTKYTANTATTATVPRIQKVSCRGSNPMHGQNSLIPISGDREADIWSKRDLLAMPDLTAVHRLRWAGLQLRLSQGEAGRFFSPVSAMCGE